MRLACFIVVCASLAEVVHGAGVAIQALSPSQGSLFGGTKLTIFGTGFAKGPMGAVSTAKVYMGGEECRVEPYYSADSRIVCYTPAAPPGVSDLDYVTVQVVITSIDTTDGIARCATGGTRPCAFRYRSDRTTRIDSVYGGGPAGKVLRLIGNAGPNDVTKAELMIEGTAPGGLGSERMRCDVSVVKTCSSLDPTAKFSAGAAVTCSIALLEPGLCNLWLHLESGSASESIASEHFEFSSSLLTLFSAPILFLQHRRRLQHQLPR